MACSALTIAKRVLIKIVLSLGICYNLVVTVNRDSDDADIVRACRRLVLKVHPDKGGSPDDAKKLNAARDAWDKALGAKTAPWQDPAKGAIGKPSTFETELETKAFTESFRHSPAKEKHVILMNPYFQPDPV